MPIHGDPERIPALVGDLQDYEKTRPIAEFDAERVRGFVPREVVECDIPDDSELGETFEEFGEEGAVVVLDDPKTQQTLIRAALRRNPDGSADIALVLDGDVNDREFRRFIGSSLRAISPGFTAGYLDPDLTNVKEADLARLSTADGAGRYLFTPTYDGYRGPRSQAA